MSIKDTISSLDDSQFVANTFWELWVEDRFDLDSQRKIEHEGQGLIPGLMVLWSHHLLEGIGENGSRGFTRFNLWLRREGQSIIIHSCGEGVLKIKAWVFGRGNDEPAFSPGVEDRSLLMLIAQVHSQLLISTKTEAPIIQAAEISQTVVDFKRRLSTLLKR